MAKNTLYEVNRRGHGVCDMRKVPDIHAPTDHLRKYFTYGLDSLLRRKAWLENILFTPHIKEYSSRKQACLFLDYQQLKKALKKKEEELS